MGFLGLALGNHGELRTSERRVKERAFSGGAAGPIIKREESSVKGERGETEREG